MCSDVLLGVLGESKVMLDRLALAGRFVERFQAPRRWKSPLLLEFTDVSGGLLFQRLPSSKKTFVQGVTYCIHFNNDGV